MSTQLRPELGEFNSIVCFKAVITGMEDSLGEKATSDRLLQQVVRVAKNLYKSWV
jgi:hypothetical protein